MDTGYRRQLFFIYMLAGYSLRENNGKRCNEETRICL